MCYIKFYGLFLLCVSMIVKSQMLQYNDASKPDFGECVKDFIHTFMKENDKYVLISTNKLPRYNTTHLKRQASVVRIDCDFETTLSKLDFVPLTYLIFIENANNFNITLISIRASKVYSTHSKLLIITEEKKIIQKIAQDLWETKMLRSNILLADKNNVEIHSINIIECGFKIATDRIVLSKANCSSMKVKVNLKAILKGCPLYVITGNMPPFVNPENETLKGIFMEMMDVFGQVSQRELIVRPYDSIYLDELVQSYNFQPVMDAFESGYAEIFIGPLQFTVFTFMDVGPVFLSNNLMFLAPREFISGPIDILSSAFNMRSLAILCVVVTCVIVAFNIFARYTADRNIFGSLSKSIFLFIGIFLNTAFLNKMPKNIMLQLFIICLLHSILILNIYLQGNIISILNGPFYEPPIKSIGELLQKNIPIKLFPTLAFFFGYNNEEIEYYQEIHDRHTEIAGGDFFAVGNSILRDRNFTGIIYEGFLTMRPNLESSFSTIEFFANTHSAGMPKNHYMSKEFREWFYQMIEHGIIEKFSKLYEFSYALQYYVENGSRVYKVTMKQMEPIISMLIIGYLVAFVAFILEIILYKITQLLRQRAK